MSFVDVADPLGRTLGRLVEGNDGAEYSAPETAKDLFELLKNYPALNLDAVGLKGVDPNKRFMSCIACFLRVNSNGARVNNYGFPSGIIWVIICACPGRRSCIGP